MKQIEMERNRHMVRVERTRRLRELSLFYPALVVAVLFVLLTVLNIAGCVITQVRL